MALTMTGGSFSGNLQMNVPVTPPSKKRITQFASWDSANKANRIILSNDNLTMATSGTTPEPMVGATATNFAATGRYYWEVVLDTRYAGIGIATRSWDLNSGSEGHYTYYAYTGNLEPLDINVGPEYDEKSRIGFALDMNKKSLWIALNGSWLDDGEPVSGRNPILEGFEGEWAPAAWLESFNTEAQITANFGQNPFADVVPYSFISGFGV